MYDNVRDAQKYLEHTIIRYKKAPVYVTRISEGVSLRIMDIKTGKESKVLITDPLLNFDPVPLGYGVDARGFPYFCFRTPRRRWKQGLHEESFSLHPTSLGYVDFGNMAGLRSIYDAIKGKHKKFKEAFKEGGVFHRYFCVKKDGETYLEYKGDVIGVFVGEELSLYENYSYLDKYVKEVMQ